MTPTRTLYPQRAAVTGSQVAKMRRKLAVKPDALKLIWRLGEIAGQEGLTITVSKFRADAWRDGDLVACAKLEGAADVVADKYEVNVTIKAPDGSVLYRRMLA